jgi:HSP20 family molecular chaperone IbpA
LVQVGDEIGSVFKSDGKAQQVLWRFGAAVAYADAENHKLVLEFAIPGAPTDTIDVKILEDRLHLTAPARDIEYVSALALGWPVKPDKAEATYEHGLLRVEVPLKDPMENAVKLVIRAGDWRRLGS